MILPLPLERLNQRGLKEFSIGSVAKSPRAVVTHGHTVGDDQYSQQDRGSHLRPRLS
jgi:hypothetical protein